MGLPAGRARPPCVPTRASRATSGERLSYIDQRVSTGVDVHKETYTVTCVCHKHIVNRATVTADPAGLVASVWPWFPAATLSSVDAAGFSAFVRHRALTTAGITNMVVTPASVAVAANEKVETDRRDAKTLAIALADGRVRGLSVPTAAEELARLLPNPRAACRTPRHHGPANHSHAASMSCPSRAGRNRLAREAP
jgi:hypothetical protein